MEEKTNKAKEIFRTHFTAPRIAYMAIFTALAFLVTFLQFPIFPAASFLQLDFSNVFFMIEGFIFGPVEAVISIVLMQLLCLTKTQTIGAGEVANIIMSIAYIIIPSVGYRFKKGKKWVIIFLVCACVFQVAVSLLVNRFINFPLYGSLSGFDGVEYFKKLWPFVVYFNIIKSVGISVIVFLVYKPLSKFIKATSAKFEHRKVKKDETATTESENSQK